MASDQTYRAYELFETVLGKREAERAAFLDRECAGDAALGAEIESLLAADAEAESFLEPPRRGRGSTSLTAGTGGAWIGRKIGAYHIRGVVASGGMGTIYEAVQEHPRRTVALKALRRGIASKPALRRFEHESEILAHLRHPNIAQVYEASTYDDGTGVVPYFVMEYVPGAKPITHYVTDENLGMRARLELFAHVCDAVHHGHQKGIIHRDLKPSNILVDSTGVVKVIDFGVARSTDSNMAITTMQTDIGQLIGTLQYMSPEQCVGNSHDIDTRSDVYALGVVLYELLCGRLPYDVSHKTLHDATTAIREQLPTRPSTISRTLRGDVETITLKALVKDRERRYRSAAEFGEDIGRYLRGEPILARPASVTYQLRTFARRNSALVGAIAAVFVVLVVALIVIASQYVRAERARAEATVERDRALAAERLADQRRDETVAVNDFLNNDLLAAAAPNREPRRDLSIRQVLDKASETVRNTFERQPLVDASIRMTLGNTYMSLGEYEQAELHLARALELRTAELGDEHPDTLTAMDRLGVLYSYSRLGRYEQAEPLWRKALDVRRRVLGDQHPDTLESMDNLAGLEWGRGRYDHAEALWLQTLELRRRLLGREHKDTLITLSNLALLNSSRGRYDQAEPLWVQTLDLRRRVLGYDHPDTMYSMHHLAITYAGLGRYDEAKSLFLRTIQLRRQVLGDAHPDTLETVGHLGVMLCDSNELEEARTRLREAVEKSRASLGDDHKGTGIWRSHLGMCLTRMRNYSDAEQELRQGYRVLAATLGADHGRTIKVTTRLVSLYEVWDKPDKAAEWRAKLSHEDSLDPKNTLSSEQQDELNN